MQEEKKQLKDIGVFEIDSLIRQTYNKIAAWHNDDGTGPGLKNLSIELIQDIAGAAFDHLGIPYNGTKIQMDDETKRKVDEERSRIASGY